jgi:XTP/dITP diphosphohydrolase
VSTNNSLPTLLIATTNKGKIREFRQLLAALPANVVTLAEVGIDFDVEEGDDSFAANAMLKAKAYHQASGLLTLAEDSGFQVDALNGEPGVRSARWGGGDYGVKNALIVQKVAGLPVEQRGCQYIAVLAIQTPAGKLYRRTGTCRGRVADTPAGTNGFGYDPIFLVPNRGKTMGEMTDAEKASLSHRGRAVRRALPLLRQLLTDPSQLARP